MAESEVLFLAHIEIKGLDTEEGLVDVKVYGWERDDKKPAFTTIPAFRLMRAGLLEKALERGMVLAKINLVAKTEEDLRFQNFEEVPVPTILAFSNS